MSSRLLPSSWGSHPFGAVVESKVACSQQQQHVTSTFALIAGSDARVVQQGALVESKNTFGESLLAKAFDKGSVELFQANLNCAWEVLDHDQVLS